MNNLKFNYIINIKNKSIGRISSYISKFLIKIKNIKITIINFKKIKEKKYNKIYYKHSGFPGGLKKLNYKFYDKKNLLINCIKNMLKKNKTKKKLIKKIIFNKNKKKYKIINI